MGELDDPLALQRRIAAAQILGLESAHPARDVILTRLDRRVYLGVKGAGFVRLRSVEAHAIAAALDRLAGLVDGEAPGEHHHL